MFSKSTVDKHPDQQVPISEEIQQLCLSLAKSSACPHAPFYAHTPVFTNCSISCYCSFTTLLTIARAIKVLHQSVSSFFGHKCTWVENGKHLKKAHHRSQLRLHCFLSLPLNCAMEGFELQLSKLS